MSRPRSLSGIKPSGTPHLGNLLGMMLPALKLQDNHDCLYFIADYHALTTLQDGPVMRQLGHELTAAFLAFGLDVNKHIWYRQSDLPEVTELAWILSCFTPQGLLERGHAYKDAVTNKREINHGLFAYPVLMAADILIFDSEVVPVGRDQKQHVEMARDIAQKINNTYGEGTLTLPEASIQEEVQTIMGLDGRKMSKSYGNIIPIFETPKKLRKTVMKITTDSAGVDDAKDPEKCNIFSLYKLVANLDQQAELAGRYRAGGMGYGEAKQSLYESLEELIGEPRETYSDWLSRPDDLEDILKDGARKARERASPVMERLRSRAGLGRG